MFVITLLSYLTLAINKEAEDYYTVKALLKMGKDNGVDLPICSAVYDILYNGNNAREVLDKLFTRTLKNEF